MQVEWLALFLLHLVEFKPGYYYHHFQITLSTLNLYSLSPKEIILKWVSLFNQGNAKALALLYHDDAINHQVANPPIVGRMAIEQMFASGFATADMACIVENIFEDGHWVILEWQDPLGLSGCGFFKIELNKIRFQRGYWDKLSFLRIHGLPFPGDDEQ